MLKNITQNQNGDYRVTGEVDERLKREFPQQGDQTIYTSCLLRCEILLRGADHLEPWQLYKAVHSALQKRGYDSDIGWKTQEEKDKSPRVKKSTTDEDDPEQLMGEFKNHLSQKGFPKDRQLPCFFEAYCMGLWHPDDPNTIRKMRQDQHAQHAGLTPGKGYTASRQDVEQELKIVLAAIQKRYPKLDVEKTLFGKYGIQYASCPQVWQKHPQLKKDKIPTGTAQDWQGILGQKTPRFDNRIIAKCLLMPRFGVCKIKSSNEYNQDFLKFNRAQQLRTLRVVSTKIGSKDSDAVVTKGRPLNHKEFTVLFESMKDKIDKKVSKKNLETQLEKLHLQRTNNVTELDAPKPGGRCSFSRPALRKCVEFFESGLSPAAFYEKVLKEPRHFGDPVLICDNTEPLKGLIPTDFDWLKDLKNATWEDFYLVQERYKVENPGAEKTPEEKKRLIKKQLANTNNPVVRHRLLLLLRTIEDMRAFLKQKYHGLLEPDHIVFELLREDFMGGEAKKKLQDFQKKQRQSWEQLRNEFGRTGHEAMRRRSLWKRQDTNCFYTGERIGQTQIDDCEVDHVLPRTAGGPDAQYNIVLTSRTANKNKGERIPYEWFHGANPPKKQNGDVCTWKEFVTRVNSNNHLPSHLKKISLATSVDEAKQLAERCQAKAETSWIARLASALIHTTFDWVPQIQGGPKKIHFIRGKLTERVRRENKLNHLLLPNKRNANKEAESEEKESNSSKKKSAEPPKNREDKRHHMLDAMVITYCQEWRPSKDKKREFELPPSAAEDIHKVLATHLPVRRDTEKPCLQENFYGARTVAGETTPLTYLFKRSGLIDLGLKKNQQGVAVSFDTKAVASFLENMPDFHPEICTIIENIQRKIEREKDNPMDAWVKLAEGVVLKNGTKVRRVKDFTERIDEDKELDANGDLKGGRYFIKPKGAHKGFLICRSQKVTKNKTELHYAACPIYVWQTPEERRQELQRKGLEVVCELKSGDYVEVTQDVVSGVKKIKKGLYRLASIKNSIQVVLEHITSLTNLAPNPKELSAIPKLALNTILSQSSLQQVPPSLGPVP